VTLSHFPAEECTYLDLAPPCFHRRAACTTTWTKTCELRCNATLRVLCRVRWTLPDSSHLESAEGTVQELQSKGALLQNTINCISHTSLLLLTDLPSASYSCFRHVCSPNVT
jgi:hypothetical protein